MTPEKKNLRTCPNGHRFYKTSDCPTCPVCEKEQRPRDGFLSILGAPARRALEREGIKSLKQLSNHSETELLKLHGFGPSSIPKLQAELRAEGLTFRKE